MPPQTKSGRRSRAEGVEVYTYKELEIATNNFSEEKKIGSGVHGNVYKGVLSDGTVVAIKKLHMLNDNASNQKHEERSFRIEVSSAHFIYCSFLSTLFVLIYCFHVTINISISILKI